MAGECDPLPNAQILAQFSAELIVRIRTAKTPIRNPVVEPPKLPGARDIDRVARVVLDHPLRQHLATAVDPFLMRKKLENRRHRGEPAVMDSHPARPLHHRELPLLVYVQRRDRLAVDLIRRVVGLIALMGMIARAVKAFGRILFPEESSL